MCRVSLASRPGSHSEGLDRGHQATTACAFSSRFQSRYRLTGSGRRPRNVDHGSDGQPALPSFVAKYKGREPTLRAARTPPARVPPPLPGRARTRPRRVLGANPASSDHAPQPIPAVTAVTGRCRGTLAQPILPPFSRRQASCVGTATASKRARRPATGSGRPMNASTRSGGTRVRLAIDRPESSLDQPRATAPGGARPHANGYATARSCARTSASQYAQPTAQGTFPNTGARECALAAAVDSTGAPN
jgi:hypothetical protein